MITLVSYLIVLIGAFNWFCIGVLQFDFIAGIFGSQANIFSRLVYTIVGFSAIWLIYATIKQRGRIIVNGKKENDEKLLGKLKDRVTKDNKEEKKIEAIGTQEPDKKETKKEDDVTPPIKMQDDNKMIGLGADVDSNN